MPQLVFGLGTGRCGSTSLAAILNGQPNARVTHEWNKTSIRWQGSLRNALAYADYLTRESYGIVGDVAFYWLPYVSQIARRHPASKFVCLKRPQMEYVESFIQSRKRNAWLEVECPHHWDACFPKFGMTDMQVAGALYWELYYRIAEQLERELPGRFRIFGMGCLNSVAGQCELLDFLGFTEKVVQTGIRMNAR